MIANFEEKEKRFLKDVTSFKKRFEKISRLDFNLFVSAVLDREISRLEEEKEVLS